MLGTRHRSPCNPLMLKKPTKKQLNKNFYEESSNGLANPFFISASFLFVKIYFAS